MKSLIHPQTPVSQLKFENGWLILSHTLLGMWLLIHAMIKVDPDNMKNAWIDWDDVALIFTTLF